ncbi:MAG: hypothetical protein ACYDEJ_13160 [Desulfitobacteriaceae bacterium]
MSQRPARLLTITELKQRLKELSREEVITLLVETLKSNKDAQAFISVKLQGEKAILELIKEYKEKIHKEFYPDRGYPKMRVTKVREVFSDLNKIAKETVWLLELMVFFAETAVQSIHECGDIFEDMGDYLADMYYKIIQRLNKEKTPELYHKYKERLKTIAVTKNCECWGIHDSLVGSYSELKWLENDAKDIELD